MTNISESEVITFAESEVPLSRMKTESANKIGGVFPDNYMEALYVKFNLKQKQDGLGYFLVISSLFDVYMLIALTTYNPILSGIICGFLIVHLLVMAWYERSCQSQFFWWIVPHMAVQMFVAQIMLAMILNPNDETSRDALGWLILLTYSIYLTLPFKLSTCSLLVCSSILIYNGFFYIVFNSQLYFYYQVIINNILLITTNMMGLASFLVEDRQQRKAFLETRQSLEIQLAVEEQGAEQERLLLSVLPKHVATQMRQDLDQADSQFKKIYMSRHENVSILYADIVGFTAISSTYSAQDLVKMLNELFARFDNLAERFQQLRIKILGDCYYCISGAPIERPDHAVLSIHMGLSMVDAIKYLQKTTNSPVDMRVGIHTGAVLAGVLGQRQWQFDVYSKDVELANKMESSGVAGRVHISATTLSFLNGEFEVEPAYGEKREEALRMAGLKTYFIVKVLQPFCDDSNDKVSLNKDNSLKNYNLEGTNFELSKPQKSQDCDSFMIRLQKELINKNCHKELYKKTNRVLLHFTEHSTEKAYGQQLETFSIFTCIMIIITKLSTIASIFILMSRSLTENVIFITENVVLFIEVLVLLLLELIPMLQTKSMKNLSIQFHRTLSGMCILSLGIINVVDTVLCVQLDKNPSNCVSNKDISTSCTFPSYFSYFTLLILITSSIPASLSYLWKTAFMIIVTALQCSINIFLIDHALECEETRRQWNSLTKGKYTLFELLLAATIAMSLLARHMEQLARLLFLRRCEVESQQYHAADMARRNEALVFNILPPHVAAHFMSSKNRHHDELYSQSYAEVGVLFASMPNFSDFYSEETVNNQGLECLRFLNEVISDFDALLELPQFQNIIKIKTIGSTYMAASGLNLVQQFKPEDQIIVRWRHLSTLVEFALELKSALQHINEQSFNHFVLKMGINHGPITAGVIGARKPHYDIWGNTVNVASRMESTGKAGYIQVTEETCTILQNFDYEFEQRGLVVVKGKGQLMTYYLQGKSNSSRSKSPMVPTSPLVSMTALEVVSEEDESHNTSSFTSKSEDRTVIECGREDSQTPLPNDDDDENTLDKEIDPLLH